MTAATATIERQAATSVSVHVPAGGAWFADVECEGAPELSGRVTIALGDLELHGTVVPSQDGTHALQRRLRVVAGAGRWASMLPARAYHNDARIRARTPAEDIVREAGEELGDFAPALERIGIDYVRQAGLASRALEDVIGGAPWWVDFDGVTHVGARSSSAAELGSYELLEFDPRTRVAVIVIDDLRRVGIGSILSDRLDVPQTIREYSIEWTSDRAQVRAWLGGGEASRDRVLDALRAIVARFTDGRIYGPRRYRVVGMQVDRVRLQPVTAAGGLPVIEPISMWPGMAGLHADLAAGAHVLVEFIDGDRTQPIVTHFAGKDGTGWEPSNVVLTAATTVRLGAADASEGVPRGTTLKDWIDDHTHGYLGDSGTPAMTTPPILPPYVGGPGTPNPSPDPSSKVLVPS